MNEYVLTAAVILAILGAGLGLLLRFGVTEAAYFGVFVVAATIVGSVGYTWWKTQTDKTVERLRRELLLKIKKDIANTKKNVLEASELVEQDQVLADIEEIKRNLINLGLYDKNFRVTSNAKNFTLTLIEQENRKTEQRLRGLENMAAVSYRPKLEEYIEGLEAWLDELENTGFRIREQREEFKKIATQESVSLKELLDKRERLARAFSGILKECGTEVQELLKLAEKYGSVKRMSKTVAKAKKSFEDFETGVENLVEARNQLKNFLQDFYEIEHRQMTSSINNLSPVLKNDYILRERRETLERIMEEALAITDPGLIGELHRLKKEYKEEVLSLVQEMHSGLKDLEEKISAFSPPTDIWMEDEKGEALVGRLRIDSELRVFSRHSAEAIEHLTARLRESDVLLRILQNYDKIESLITAKLRHSGRLAATDLNVKYSDKFLLIYSKKHSDTIYRQTTSTLVKI